MQLSRDTLSFDAPASWKLTRHKINVHHPPPLSLSFPSSFNLEYVVIEAMERVLGKKYIKIRIASEIFRSTEYM